MAAAVPDLGPPSTEDDDPSSYPPTIHHPDSRPFPSEEAFIAAGFPPLNLQSTGDDEGPQGVAR
jgi:hypothetical protein